MVMPMSYSEDSMFPADKFNYTSYEKDCINSFGVEPRPQWITTEFGGHVSYSIKISRFS
jgi:lysosomal Pro-X carboxypeptidase